MASPMFDNTMETEIMTRNAAKAPRTRRKAAPSTDAETTRFEFARRHIIQLDKLTEKSDEAWNTLYEWLRSNEDGTRRAPSERDRRPRTQEEREQLKTLESAYVDARARLLLHENEGLYL